MTCVYKYREDRLIVAYLFMKRSSKFCDNILVKADIFTTLRVSFSVTDNAFNLFREKSKNLRTQFRKYSMTLWDVVGFSIRIAQKILIMINQL